MPGTAKSLTAKIPSRFLGMQVRIRTNSLEFEFAPNSLEFVDPPEFKFEIKNFKFLYHIHSPVLNQRMTTMQVSC